MSTGSFMFIVSSRSDSRNAFLMSTPCSSRLKLGDDHEKVLSFIFNVITVIDSLDSRGPRLLRVGDDIPDVDLGPYVTVVVVATVAVIVVVAHAWTHG